MNSLAELFAQLKKLDVKLWVEGEALRINAPKGTLTPELRSQLAENKSAILDFLNSAAGKNWTQDSLPAQQKPALTSISTRNQIPLSFAQQQLWFLSQLEGPSATYNIPLALNLRGDLNLPALQKSCAEIVRRHEALRTTFSVDENGKGFQVIHPPTQPNIEILDLTAKPADTRDLEFYRATQKEARRLFNLEKGPLFRLLLLQKDATHFTLFVVMHHIISDGWSLEIFCRELAQLYETYVSGKTPALPELPIQYPSFAMWQREWLSGATLEDKLTYWRNKLSGTLPTLELPSDRPRPAVQSYRGAAYNFLLPHSMLNDLKTLSNQQGVTLFMTLLAAFDVLLFRYTGQTDLLIGTPVANRNEPEIESLIGFFVNTLVLRNDLSGNPTFSELLKRVRQTALEAYDQQDVPFEKLVRVLHPDRNPSHSPLFQIMFALETALPTFNLPNLALTSSMVDNGSAKFDLTLFLTETAEGLAGKFEYNSDLFDSSTIAHLAAHLNNLLTAILANPHRGIDYLPFLGDAEIQQIITEWNDTKIEIPENLCAHHLIEAQAARTPEAIALQFRDEKITYKEMNARANQLARELRKLNITEGALVGVCMERSPEMIIGLLGILKAGAAYIPLDSTYPLDRLTYMAKDSGLTILLSQRRLQKTMEPIATQTNCRVIYLDEAESQSADESNLELLLSPDDLAYVIYTSGTTGLPKGAMITHRGLVNYLLWCQRYYPLQKGQGSPVHSSISFDLTVTSLFTPLLVGSKVILLPEELRVESLANALLKENDFSLIKITPAHLQVLGDQIPKANAANSAHAFVIGGENLTTDHIKFWQTNAPQAQLINEYGPTETVVGCCVYTVPSGKSFFGAIPIGKPISNTSLYVLDRNLQPVPIGVRGELYIGGLGVARGYLNRPDLTAEKFLPDPFSSAAGARMYRTGDVARYLPDGNLECLGRADFQVKIRGYRIELGEVESALADHAEVSGVVALVREDRVGDKRLVAYIIGAATENSLRDFLRNKLPEYMMPSAYVYLTDFPLTANGKVDRKRLPAPDMSKINADKDFIAPQTNTEIALANIMAELLGVEKVGLHDNFFDLGGHSILATQLAFRARQFFQTEIPLYRFFENPTIRGLTNVIQNGLSERMLSDTIARRRSKFASIKLDESIQPVYSQTQTLSTLNRVFLTGATGFLGVYLLADLLQSPNTIVYCLVRAQNIETARERLFAHLAHYRLWREEYAERIQIVVGDIAEADFGLTPSEFLALAENIDSVIHCAARVNFIFPYDTLKPANVLGTQTVLRLATIHPNILGAKPVHHVSTLSVFEATHYSNLVIDEQMEPEYSANLRNGYAQSKWAAEKLILEARRRGIPVTIHRPGTISGDTRNGIWNAHDYFPLFIKGCIQLGAIPNQEKPWRLTPVDYVSQAIVSLMSQPQSINQAFHYISPYPIRHQSIAGWLRQAGYTLNLLDMPAWQAKLEPVERDVEHALYPLLPFLLENDETQDTETGFSTSRTDAMLLGARVICPPVDEDVFNKYIMDFIRQGFISPP